jgi:hypothetical protein
MKQFTFSYHSFKIKNGSYHEDTTQKGRLFNQVSNVAEYLLKRYNFKDVEIVFVSGVKNGKRIVKFVFRNTLENDKNQLTI